MQTDNTALVFIEEGSFVFDNGVIGWVGALADRLERSLDILWMTVLPLKNG